MNDVYPAIPTYQGGKTNSHIGSYSGITDIQGMDAYLGACAPTIVPVIKPLPIDYPYLYLKNTRDNHMPLPTWLYSQLYSMHGRIKQMQMKLLLRLHKQFLLG